MILLITGEPGSGKSNLVQKTAVRYADALTGFTTKRIFEQERRMGFRVETLTTPQKSSILAHRHLHRTLRQDGYSVGPYHVNARAIEEIMVTTMQNAPATARPIVIDEIAHMSMLSETFRTEVTRVFESGIPIIATIHIRPDPFTDALKARQDVRLLTLNDENRMQVQTELIAAIDRMLA